MTRFSGFASGAGPVLADEGKQNPEAAEEMMVAEIRYDDCGGRLFVKVLGWEPSTLLGKLSKTSCFFFWMDPELK